MSRRAAVAAAVDLSHRRRGVGRRAGRGIGARARRERRRACSLPASADGPWRPPGLPARSRSTNFRSSALPQFRDGCRQSFAASARPRTPSSPRDRTRSSSSTARISPIGSRAGCGGARPRSRFSIMSRRRFGRGGPGGRAPCAPMSITSWRSCRSSRRPIVRLGGPPCIYVGHPLIERARRTAAQCGRGEAPAQPIRRSCWSCRAAASSEIRPAARRSSAPRSRASPRASAPIELVLPTVPHLAAQVRDGSAGWAVTPRIVSSRPRNGPPFAARARHWRHPAR